MATGAPKKQERTKSLVARARERALDLIAYVDASPTPYHAVAESIRRLEQAGFEPLRERDEWKLKGGEKRWVTRNGSSLIAFQVGTKSPAKSGFKMLGAHTDSPNLKLKPRASYTKNGYKQLGVEVYGGVLLHTWLDRDLSLAGRVAVRGAKGQVELRLLDLQRPILRIPNLAIHLNRDVNTNGLKINQQTNLPPILSLVGDAGAAKKGDDQDFLRALIADALKVPTANILEHDLSLYDVQKGTLAGLDDEFINVARLDNLASCHAALDALLAGVESPGAATKLIALHDHEEIGSRSAQGAAGPFLEDLTRRVVESHEKQEGQAFARAMACSFHISSDMAHAVHPNYSDRHEPQHMPMIGLGPVIKTNASQSYATDGESAATFIALCQSAGVEPQSFVARTDLGCGSTIGPITAGRLGVKTVDIGNPMMSMHSIREMAGTLDLELLHRPLAAYFRGA